MASPAKLIERQMVKLLKADSTFLLLIPGGVHSHIPEKPSYPYIRIGDALESKFNTFGKVGKETDIKLYIYSTKPTDEEVLDIVDAADTLLDDVALTITGWKHVLISWESTQVVTETDNRSRYAVVTYRVITEKN